MPEWKSNSDQTCSCPRDWRLSTSRWPNSVPPWNSSDHHSTIVLRGLRRPFNWPPIMPKNAASLSSSGCKFSHPGDLYAGKYPTLFRGILEFFSRLTFQNVDTHFYHTISIGSHPFFTQMTTFMHPIQVSRIPHSSGFNWSLWVRWYICCEFILNIRL